MTNDEREKNRHMRMELKERRENGKDCIIKNMEVVMRRRNKL